MFNVVDYVRLKKDKWLFTDVEEFTFHFLVLDVKSDKLLVKDSIRKHPYYLNIVDVEKVEV